VGEEKDADIWDICNIYAMIGWEHEKTRGRGERMVKLDGFSTVMKEGIEHMRRQQLITSINKQASFLSASSLTSFRRPSIQCQLFSASYKTPSPQPSSPQAK